MCHVSFCTCLQTNAAFFVSYWKLNQLFFHQEKEFIVSNIQNNACSLYCLLLLFPGREILPEACQWWRGCSESKNSLVCVCACTSDNQINVIQQSNFWRKSFIHQICWKPKGVKLKKVETIYFAIQTKEIKWRRTRNMTKGFKGWT